MRIRSFFPIFLTALFAAPQLYAQDKATLQFHVTQGKSTHSGAQDAQASGQFYVEDGKFRLEVDITDDQVNFKEDPVNSDHVEIWFSAFEFDNRMFRVGDDTYEFNDDMQTKPEFVDAYNRVIEENGVELGDDGEKITEADVMISQDLTGLSHFALLSHRPTAQLFDDMSEGEALKGRFSLMEFASSVKYDKTEAGYRVTADFKPQALRYVPALSLKHIHFQVDIIDLDDKSQSVLSTNPDRKWGQTKGMARLQWQEPILLDQGLLSDPAYPGIDLFENQGLRWMPLHRRDLGTRYIFPLTAVEWVEVQAKFSEESIGSEKIGVETYTLEEYVAFPVQHVYLSVRGNLLPFYTSDAGETALLPADNSDFADRLWKGKLLSNGTLLLEAYTAYPVNPVDGAGPCGACTEENLTFYKFEKGKNQAHRLNIRFVDGNMALYFGEYSAEGELKAYEWEKQGKSLRLDFRLESLDDEDMDAEATTSFRVTWDKAGKAVIKRIKR